MEGVVGADRGLVGRHGDPVGGLGGERQRAVRQRPAGPLVLGAPAGRRLGGVAAGLAHRDGAGDLHADGPLAVGEDNVDGGYRPRRERLTRGRDVLGERQVDERVEGRRRCRPGPLHRDRQLLVEVRAPCRRRRLAGLAGGGVDVGEDRSVPGGPDGEQLGPGAGHVDGLGAGAHGAGAPVGQHPAVADALDDQVGRVETGGGHAPRHLGVVSLHDARHPGQRETGDVPGALRPDIAAVQAHLHERSRHLGGEVRVDGQQRRARRGRLGTHDHRVAPDAGAATDALRQRVERPSGRLDRTHPARPEAHPLGVAAAALGGAGLEPSVDDRAAGDDRRHRLVGVRRPQLLGPLGAHGVGDQHALDLVGRAAAEVPAEGLQPGQRVHGRPVLRGRVGTVEVEQGVLHGQLGGLLLGEVGVDPVGVGLQERTGVGTEQRHLLLGDDPEAERARDPVPGQRAGTHELGERARRAAAPHVHLEEPLLGGDVALGDREVGDAVGVDLGDTGTVAQHRHRPGQARHLELAAGLRQRPPGQREREQPGHHQREHQAGHDVGRDPHRVGHPPEGAPPRGRTGRGSVRGAGRGVGRSRVLAHGAGHSAVT